MSTRVVGLRGIAAVAGATAITAVSAWAFVVSSASIDRDPFKFAAVMSANANAKARIVQLHSPSAFTCPNNPEARDPLAPVCLGG